MRWPVDGRRRGLGRIAAGGMLVSSLMGAAPAYADFEAAAERLQRGDVANALPELRALAREGDARAQDTLAGLHLQGLGVERDVGEAMGWYCRVAHHPSGGPQVMHAVWFLAEYFRTGGGVPGSGYNDGRREEENPLRAYFWFSVLAGQDDLYDRLDERSRMLGKIGMNAVGGELYDHEKAALGAALARWRPAQPVDSAAACLALPEGL